VDGDFIVDRYADANLYDYARVLYVRGRDWAGTDRNTSHLLRPSAGQAFQH
jgi:hypothetical protein